MNQIQSTEIDITTRIRSAIKDMESNIERDSKHIYVNKITGIRLQGVSTVSNIMPKEWLAAWGAKEAVKALGYTDYTDYTTAFEVWNKIKSCEKVEDYIKILKDSKGASGRKSKKAMLDGTKGHKILENLVITRINNSMPSVALPTDELERPVKQWIDWEAKEVKFWIASEGLVYNPDKGYAGQFDAIYMSTKDELTIGDFKFASHLSEDYEVQLALYAACFEPYNVNFDKRILIRLPKTLMTEEWDANEYKYKMIENNIEPFVVTSPYEMDRNVGYAMLPVKQYINYKTKSNNNNK